MYLTDTQSVSFNQEKGFFWDHKNYEDGNFSGKTEKFHWAWKPWFSGAGSKINDTKRNNVCWDREGSISTECLWKIMKAWHSYCWTKGKGADQLLVKGTPQEVQVRTSRLGCDTSTLIPGWATNIPAKKTVCLNAKDRDYIFMKEKSMLFQALWWFGSFSWSYIH